MTNRHAILRCVAITAAIALCTMVVVAQDHGNRKVRIIQTNSTGDNVHLIDPATNKVVGVISGIEVNHGVGAAPDGSRIYISDEAESTLDAVDAKTLKIIKKVKLSGHPNNMAVARDGKRAHDGINQDPGRVPVICQS